MQPQANKHRGTDYTNQLRPRRHSMDGLSNSASKPMFSQAAAPKAHTKPAARPSGDEEEYKVSININLPDYNQWRIAKFARQYPFMSLGLAILGLLAFALLVEGMVTLWHSLHHHTLPPAVMILGGK